MAAAVAETPQRWSTRVISGGPGMTKAGLSRLILVELFPFGIAGVKTNRNDDVPWCSYSENIQDNRYERLLREGMTYTKVVPILPTAVEMRVILRDASNGNIGDVGVPLGPYFPAGSRSGN